jgi:PKD repeat protein
MRSSFLCPRIAVASSMLLWAAVACNDDSDTNTATGPIDGPSLAVAVQNRTPWRAPQDPSDPSTYLLPKACDVFIGEPSPEAPEPGGVVATPLKFDHQLLVVADYTDNGDGSFGITPIPSGSTVKLVRKADYPGIEWAGAHAFPSGVTDDELREPSSPGFDKAGAVSEAGTVFACNAEDPDTPGQPVVEPVTDHAGKGDGPQVNSDGITFDLNGYSIQAFVSATDLNPAYDNIGVTLGGANGTIKNSSERVVWLSRFGHNLEAEAENPTLSGKRPNGLSGYGIETPGGVGVRLSSGTVTVEFIRSVDRTIDPVEGAIGTGFEIRNCAGGSTSSIRNNYFVGSGEGVFIRQCSGVLLDGNTIGSPRGPGVVTREAVGRAGFPVSISNNTIDMKLLPELGVGPTGILWARASDNPTITGNTITGFADATLDPAEPATPCGIQFTSGTNLPDAETLEATNTIEGDPKTCGAPVNQPPVASFSQSCPTLDCSFTSTSTDADGSVASVIWNFGDGTGDQPSASASVQHTFAANGTYNVSLTAIDNRGKQSTVLTRSVVVPEASPPPAAAPISLTATGLTSGGPRRADLRWSGAVGTNVIIRRGSGTNPLRNLVTTLNDGRHVDEIDRGTWRYQVCNTAQTVCSEIQTVTIR